MENVNAEDIYKQGVSQINIGTGEDIEIGKLAELIKEIVGFRGEIEYDRTKPDGTPRKLLDVSRLNRLGWKHTTTLEEGLSKTYECFLQAHSIAAAI
jgi:GDP-L-fucose synthase